MGEAGAVSRFKLYASGVDISAVNAELDVHPELWNAWTLRTQEPESAHHDISDIWLRGRDREEGLKHKSFTDRHFSVFWPAWLELPALWPIVRNLSHVVGAVQLGAILITKTPPGKQVRPHVDGGWHAKFYDTKLYLVLRSNPLCINSCGGEIENFRSGDVWEYPNSVPHGVDNKGETNHINVIICFRTVDHEISQTFCRA